METNYKRHYFSDMGVMIGRSMRHISRSVDTIITVTIMPICMMLMLVYVIGGAINTRTDNYVNYLIPSIFLMAIASGVAYTALRINNDVTKGIFERFHSMPIAKSAVLWGHVLTSLVANAISIVVIILAALLMGFRPSANLLQWLSVFGILFIFDFSITWLAVISGLSAKTSEGAGVFSYPLIFLMFISSAFVPTDTMKGPVRAFAENQPVTAIINSIRSLLAGQAPGNDIWIALFWCVVITVIAYIFAMKVYRNRFKR